jgi:prevent-host-death family protein
METVGIRELKNHLSAYVRRVEAGEIVIVTDRGRVVAELVPPGWQRPAVDVHPGLLELVRRDGLRLPTRPHNPELYRRSQPPVDLHGVSVEELIDFTREDRA